MAYELDIDVRGDEEVARMLRSAGARALNAAPAMREVIEVFRDSERALWSRGRSWAPNAPATIARKGSNSPLVRSGALRDSLTAESHPAQINEVTDDTAKFGSSLWYAHFALGTKEQPKREVVKLRAIDRVQIREIIREWVVRGAAGI